MFGRSAELQDALLEQGRRPATDDEIRALAAVLQVPAVRVRQALPDPSR
ncbi:hypothetical protein [Actinoplanes sp. URMC 104]